MATNSSDLALGSPPPPFSLPDVVSGKVVSEGDIAGGRPLLVMFLSRHCPYVKHVEPELARLGRDYGGRVGMVGISANDATTYPDDAPDSLKEQARAAGFAFPYLYDESQAVARAYKAECTPEFYLFTAARTLAYHGRLDPTRPGGPAPDGKDLRGALDAVLASRAPATPQSPSVGCSIKWKR
jgi:thiol-disulfide isomerase/thioredoxin